MPNKWTAAQLAAITASDSDILVSAAAGSGKTTALTERIIRRVTAGGDLSRMLIVTFSRASAAAMKEKIGAALRAATARCPDDPHLRRQLAALSGAKISTIHSFCLSLLRRYYGELGLPPRLRVADDAETKYLRREIMDDTINYFYSQKSGGSLDFAALTDTVGGGRDDGMTELFLRLYTRTCCYPERYRLFSRAAETLTSAADDKNGIYSTPYGAPIIKKLSRALDYYEKIMSAACRDFECETSYDGAYAKYLPVFRCSLDAVTGIKSAVAACDGSGFDRDAIAAATGAYSAQRLPSVRGEKPPRVAFFCEKRTELTKFIREFIKDYLSVPRETEKTILLRTAGVCSDIVTVLDKFSELYNAEKRSRAVVDYDDLEHLSLKLLSDRDPAGVTDVAGHIAGEFDEIYIDEYQDVNAVQDAIFRAISKHNRFMVGDVKQSIYGFRGSDPTVFDEYRRDYGDKTSDRGIAVFMSENFRCDEPVIDFVNSVCGGLLRFGSVSYDENDDLRYAKSEPGADSFAATRPALVRVLLADASDNINDDINSIDDINDSGNTDGDTDSITADTASREAVMIADEISRLLESCVKDDGTRILPGDICVLLRSAKNRAADIENALRAHGIPTENDAKPNFFECPEILLMLCLLNAADNPLRDIYLAGALRSPVFSFTLDELIILKHDDKRPLYRLLCECADVNDAVNDAVNDTCDGKYSPALINKCRDAKALLSRWRHAAVSATSDEFVRMLYRDTGIEALLWSDINSGGSATPPQLRAENLNILYEYARSYEAAGFRGLHRFLDYINGMIEEGANAPAPRSAQSGSDTVKIMTVHQSKGLEFPVVILAGCAGRRNESDSAAAVLFDRSAGAAMKLRADIDSTVMLDTLPRRAVASAISDAGAAEEMRILYVALTRARERLYITAGTRDATRLQSRCRTEAEFFCPHTVYTEKTYIEWILTAIYRENSGAANACEISVIKSNVSGADAASGETIQNAVHDAVHDALYDITPTDGGNIAGEIAEIENMLAERFTYSYPYKKLGGLPAKMAVSKLYPDVLDDEGGSDAADYTPAHDPGDTDYVSGVKGGGDAAARAGSATHLFLKFCDFQRLEAGVSGGEDSEGAVSDNIEAEISRLAMAGYISPGDAELIDRNQIVLFLRSSVYAEMKRADKLWREQRFNIRLPASDFTADESDKLAYRDEELLIQGIIDCFFIDHSGVVTLVDYKTDRLSPWELSHPDAAAQKLRRRHSQQLSYYSAALTRIFGSPPGHIYIYSMPLGDTVEVFV